ncbi:MAG: hypothetical protein JXR45_10370 [Deltaproteobacteria bacterium]|nr:hypothetical protein [Deltaproteobacteria bacterium]
MPYSKIFILLFLLTALTACGADENNIPKISADNILLGEELFENSAFGSDWYRNYPSKYRLVRTGENRLVAVYSWSYWSGDAYSTNGYPRTDVAAKMKTGTQATGWQQLPFYADPNAGDGTAKWFGGETTHIDADAHAHCFVHPTTQEYSVVYRPEFSDWAALDGFELPAIPTQDTVINDITGNVFMITSSTITGIDLNTNTRILSAEISANLSDVRGATTQGTSVNGTLFVVGHDSAGSTSLLLFSVDDPGTNPIEEEILSGADGEEIQVACESCNLDKIWSYGIVNGVHHIFVTADAQDAPDQILLHIFGAPGEFSTRIVNRNESGYLGTPVAVQLPLPTDDAQANVYAFLHDGHCLRTLSTSAADSTWTEQGVLEADFTVNRHGVARLDNGEVGFLSGEDIVTYYQGMPGADPGTCDETDTDEADSQTIAWGTENNLVKVDRVGAQYTIDVQYPNGEGDNPICNAWYETTNEGVASCSNEDTGAACPATSPFPVVGTLSSDCGARDMLIHFVNPLGLDAAVALPATVAGFLTTPENMGASSEMIEVNTPLTLQWSPEGFDEVVITAVTSAGDTLFTFTVDDTGETTIPGDNFVLETTQSIYFNITITGYNYSDFNFPVAEGSFARSGKNSLSTPFQIIDSSL